MCSDFLPLLTLEKGRAIVKSGLLEMPFSILTGLEEA